MDLGIAIVVLMTSWIALSLNMVTGGSVFVTDFFSLLAIAGAFVTVGHVFLRLKKYGSVKAQPPFQARRIILAGIIGLQSGKLVIITFFLCIAPDQFWATLWFMTLGFTTMTVVMRRIFLRYVQAQLVRGVISTT